MNYSSVVNVFKQSSQPFWQADWWLFFSHGYRTVQVQAERGLGHRGGSKSGERLESAVFF